MLIVVALVFNCYRFTYLGLLTHIDSAGDSQRRRIQKGRFCSFFLLGPLSPNRALLLRMGLTLILFPNPSLFFKLMRGDGVKPI